jgi:restriction system protein
MAVPEFQAFMLPVLTVSASGEVLQFGPVIQAVADALGLSPEDRAALLPSGRQTVLRNRTAWAKSYLIKAGLLESVGWGRFRITDEGRSVLAKKPARIDIKFLEQYPAFKEFRESSAESAAEETASPVNQSAKLSAEATPDELLRNAHRTLEEALASELVERIIASPPDFFERLIVSLLVSMGYGGSAIEAGRAVGRSGDNGVDGVVDQDALGLDRVYVQAKRYAAANKVGSGEIRDFFGSLDRHKATKGLFVTTSSFSPSAQETADYLSKRIVLIDGKQLARLMIRFNVGCRVEETIQLKRIDEDFFE